MRIGGVIGAVVIGIAATILLIIFTAQRGMIYAPPHAVATTSAPGFADVTLKTADGLALDALYRPGKSRRPAIFFHGNDDSLKQSLIATQAIAAAGYGVLLPEYRGYGGNPGSPGESGLYADAKAATAFLRGQGFGSGDIVAIGHSLGSGPATELATDEHLGGLIIVPGYTSLAALAAEEMGLPIAILIRDKFDNATKLARSTVPTLVLHGDADRVIPVAHGRRLAQAARTDLMLFAGGDHDLAYTREAGIAEVRWLAALDRKIASGVTPASPTRN